MGEPGTAPRGRHAPPLEVRAGHQRGRLFTAAARVFARCGYAAASAEAISREAGMSKATFYEHFSNKEDCLTAMFDVAAREFLEAMEDAGGELGGTDPAAGTRAVVGPFLRVLANFPDETQTLLVEVVGAGPRLMERRDRVLAAVARHVHRLTDGFASPHDAYAVVGAVLELASRQIRTGTPGRMEELEPVVERLVLGLLDRP